MTQQPPKSGASVQQTFSKDMSNEQLALWLRNHPSLSGTDYEEDISKLRGTLTDALLITYRIRSN